MLISPGLVKAVDFEPSDNEDEDHFARNRRTTVDVMLENSPPKADLSLPKNSDISNRPKKSDVPPRDLTRKSPVKEARPARAEANGEKDKAEKSSDTRAAKSGDKDNDTKKSKETKAVGRRRPSISAFFVKRTVKKKGSDDSTLNKSSLTTLLESDNDIALPSRRNMLSAIGAQGGEKKHAISVMLDPEEPPITIRVSEKSTVRDVIVDAVRLGMLDGKTKWQLLLVDDGEIEHMPLPIDNKVLALGNTYCLFDPDGNGNAEDDSDFEDFGNGRKEGSRNEDTSNRQKVPDDINEDSDFEDFAQAVESREQQPDEKKAKFHQYSEYKVVKTNEKGKRQMRVLGIDPQFLHNKNPEDGGRRVWRKKRPLKDVKSVTRLTGKGRFAIRFANGSSREFQCVNPNQIDEVIEKLTFLCSEMN
mmetsp:Transcript_30224/g.73568  ORF Transcript_30224/g.73568 Transcript_30224/m.73568 type:complete len:418 (+) Transcript_30224:81-1334(+)